jgi:hypothetical protein
MWPLPNAAFNQLFHPGLVFCRLRRHYYTTRTRGARICLVFNTLVDTVHWHSPLVPHESLVRVPGMNNARVTSAACIQAMDDE